MRIRSIIEMDNGMKYCLPIDLEEVDYKINNNEGMIPVNAICVETEYQTIWNLKGILDNKQYYTEESILINPLHIVSIIPAYTDLDEDNE